MDKKQEISRVPVFVLVGGDSEGCKSMEFYGFHEIFGPIFDDDVSPKDKDDVASLGAQPFTGFTSCPLNCSITSTRGQIFVIGGSLLSSHLKNRLWDKRVERARYGDSINFDLDELILILNGEYPLRKLYSLPQHDFEYLTSNFSTRVQAFHMQQFVDSLFYNNNNNKQKGGIKFVNMDEDEDEEGFWTTCSPLTTPRICHVVSVGGRLLALGDDITDPFLEFSIGDPLRPWAPLHVYDPVDGSPKFTQMNCFVSVGIERLGFLLIGSTGMFYCLPIHSSPLSSISIPAIPMNIECPEEFIAGCCTQPGIVVDESKDWPETIVVWYDLTSFCIRGLHLGQGRYFSIHLRSIGLLRPHRDCHISDTKLIGFGDGRLALIYRGRHGCSFIDDKGVPHYLSDYRCVTFEIIYQSPSTPTIPSYPGIWLNAKIISTRKCYAPRMELEAAFVMDVCFPSQDSATRETAMAR